MDVETFLQTVKRETFAKTATPKIRALRQCRRALAKIEEGASEFKTALRLAIESGYTGPIPKPCSYVYISPMGGAFASVAAIKRHFPGCRVVEMADGNVEVSKRHDVTIVLRLEHVAR